jgi:hypothetical protein
MQKEPIVRGQEYLLRCKAAEWAVASQLALREIIPMFPAVDLGVDIVLLNGLRLQVKSASLRLNNRGMDGISHNPGYLFDLRRGAWFSTERRYKKTGLRPYSEVADYFVLWGIDENRFFIVPTSVKKSTIWFSKRGYVSKSSNRSLYDQITVQRLADTEDKWDLLDVGSIESLTKGYELPSPANALVIDPRRRSEQEKL